MKQETIEGLRCDLNKFKKTEESLAINKEFEYGIEFLPVLVKRNKEGRIEEITNYSNGILFMLENGQ